VGFFICKVRRMNANQVSYVLKVSRTQSFMLITVVCSENADFRSIGRSVRSTSRSWDAVEKVNIGELRIGQLKWRCFCSSKRCAPLHAIQPIMAVGYPANQTSTGQAPSIWPLTVFESLAQEQTVPVKAVPSINANHCHSRGRAGPELREKCQHPGLGLR
jgi:hypothetical protein